MSFAPLGMTFIALLALAASPTSGAIQVRFRGAPRCDRARVGASFGSGGGCVAANLHTSLTAPPLLLGRSSELTLNFQARWAATAHDRVRATAAVALRDGIGRPHSRATSPTTTRCATPLRYGLCSWARRPGPPLPLRVKGPFGLGWWRKPQRLDTEVVVVPDMLGGRRTRVGNAPVGAGRRSLAGTGHELDHLRDYQPGDAALGHRLEGHRPHHIAGNRGWCARTSACR